MAALRKLLTPRISAIVLGTGGFMHARTNTFLKFMAAKGLNMTEQRRKIAEVFFALPGHHSLESLYQHLHASDNSIGQTTVYRTLKLLCEGGFAHETHFGDGITRFEIAHPDAHHDHIICQHCGKTIEIFDERIEKIQQEIAAHYDFVLLGHAHNLYGLCADCRKQNAE